eukprot:jgi/Botrbrau1/5039/Bobra.37_1s0005.1
MGEKGGSKSTVLAPDLAGSPCKAYSRQLLTLPRRP